MPDKKIISLDELKKFRQETDQKYVIVGEYSPTTSVGQADTLASNREIDEPSESCPPITMGITGGNAEIKTGIEKFEYLEGNSIVFNQLLYDTIASTTSNGITFTNNGDGSITASGTASANATFVWWNASIKPTMAGHKYLLKGCPSGGSSSTYSMSDINAGQVHEYGTGVIFTKSSSGECIIAIKIASGYAISGTLTFKPQLFDLTLMGLDSITTVDEFNALYPLSYYPYNAGSILSSKAYQLVSRGRQQWDEQWESGLIQYDKTQSNFGQKITGSNVVSKNYIPVIPNQTYYFYGASTQKSAIIFCYDENKTPIIVGNSGYVAISSTPTFTTPINCKYIMFYMAQPYGTTYHNDITLSIYFADGEGYDEHYEYRQATVDLPNIELRAIGDIKDIAYASGGGTRKIGVLDLGTITYQYDSPNQRFISYSTISGAKTPETSSNKANIICAIFNVGATGLGLNNMEIALHPNGYLYIKDTSYSDADVFKTAMSGVYLLYELSTETTIPTSENAGWDENVYVDNYGTLEFITNPQQVPQVKQPYFIRYTVDLVEFLDGTYVRASGDPQNLALQEDVDKIISGETIVGESERADNLTPYGDDSGAYDDRPFVFQTSGGSADIGNGAYLKVLRGNTVAFNQLIENGNFASSSGWNITNATNITFSNNTLSCDNNSTSFAIALQRLNQQVLIQGHKYLIRLDYNFPSSISGKLVTAFNGFAMTQTFTCNGSWNNLSVISSASASNPFIIYLRPTETTGNTLQFRNHQLFDLTQMFGAGNEPTSVLEFNRLFPKPYYDYNAGTLLNAQSNGYKIVGYNAFDGEWKETGVDHEISDYIKVVAGQKYTLEQNPSGYTMRYIYQYDGNKNLITSTSRGINSSTTNAKNPITNSSEIVVILEDNTQFITIRYDFTTAPTNACFHLTWDGSKTDYEPYYSETYALPNVELKSAGSVYDTLTPSGLLTRRVGVVKLKDLTWTYGYGSFYALINDIPSGVQSQKSNILCPQYSVIESYYLNNATWLSFNKAIMVQTGGKQVCINDSSYSDATTFKNHFTDNDYLNYELATPTEEQTTNTFQEITKIDDFGTQEFLSSASIVIPQGNNFFYPVDYKAFIDSLGGREDISYDASEIVSHSELSAYGVIDAQLKDAIGGTLRQCLCVAKSLTFNNTKYVDLGTLTWGYSSANNRFNANVSDIKSNTENILSTKYVYGTSGTNVIYCIGTQVYVLTTEYSDPVVFKNAMKGILLAYEKAS